MKGVDLIETAKHLCRKGHGLLASDESTATCSKRLAKAGLDGSLVRPCRSSETFLDASCKSAYLRSLLQETRRAYRELFYCADLGNHISGAILYKEMLMQKDSSGRLFTACLTDQGILPGVKVDEVQRVICCF